MIRGRRQRDGSGRRPHALMIDVNCDVPLDRRMWLQCLALAEDGVDVSVVCPALRSPVGREVIDGIEIHRYRAPADRGNAAGYLVDYPLSLARTARLVRQVWRRKPFDMIQTCNPPDIYFVLALLYRPAGVRFLFDQPDLCPEIYRDRFGSGWPGVHRMLLALERWTHRAADQVVTVNESCRQLLLQRTATPPGRLTVVRTGADLARLRPVPPDDSWRAGRRYLCAYLGVMGVQDSVDVVVRAARELVHELGRTDVQFVLMGDGEQRADLERLATELGVQPWVTFTGFADDRLISSVLSSADLGLQPDRATEFTHMCSMLKAIEYMAFALPVVSFDLAETRRTTGSAGQVVRDETPSSFAAALAELLDDPQRRARMGAIARERAHGDLSWDRNRAIYLDVARTVLARSAARESDLAQAAKR